LKNNNLKIINIFYKYFESLNDKNIPFSILSYKDENNFSIILNKDDFQNSKQLFWDILQNNKGNVLKVNVQNNFFLEYLFILDDFIINKKKFKISIFAGDYFFNKVEIISKRSLDDLDQLYLFDLTLYKTPPKYAIVYELYLISLAKQKLTIKAFENLLQNYNIDKSGCTNTLINYFNIQRSEEIIKYIKSKNIENLLSLQTFLKKKFFINHLINNIFNIHKYVTISLKKFFINEGLSITILGPDGSGKSTLINELINLNLPFKSLKKYHFTTVKFSSKSQHINVSDPHAKPPYGYLISHLKIVYLLSIFFIFYFPKVYFPIKNGALLIFDRYLYDILIDKLRYRLKYSPFLENIILKLIPSLNLNFILNLDPKFIKERDKLEVSTKESYNQYHRYKIFSNKIKNCHLIDSSKSINHVKKKVFQKMLFLIHKKNKIIYYS